MTGSDWFYVDPEGLGRHAKPYDEHADVYRQHAEDAADIRTRHWNTWGNDETGQKFGEKFGPGLEDFCTRVAAIEAAIRYAADGLTRNGKDFREVGDNAEEIANGLRRDFDDVGTGGGHRTAKVGVEHDVQKDDVERLPAHKTVPPVELSPTSPFRPATALKRTKSGEFLGTLVPGHQQGLKLRTRAVSEEIPTGHHPTASSRSGAELPTTDRHGKDLPVVHGDDQSWQKTPGNAAT